MGQEPDPAQDPQDPQDPPAADPEPAADPQPDPDDGLDAAALRAELKRTREEAARHRIAAREAREKAKEYEDRDKSEAQKLQERAEAAEKELAAAQRAAMVAGVALSKGLTEAQAKRLIGTTVEELEADADELLATFAPEPGQEPVSGRRPQERLRPGAAPESSGDDEETDPAKLAALVRRPY